MNNALMRTIYEQKVFSVSLLHIHVLFVFCWRSCHSAVFVALLSSAQLVSIISCAHFPCFRYTTDWRQYTFILPLICLLGSSNEALNMREAILFFTGNSTHNSHKYKPF